MKRTVWPRAILHLDMDAFFVNVHILENPEDKNIPLAVGGGKLGKRGVIASASYEARELGIHSAMPVHKALKICPNLKLVPSNRPLIRSCSLKVMEILSIYGQLEKMSVDEAFVDITPQKNPPALAKSILKRIKNETGLPASLGLSTSKLVSKIASDFEKPEGFTVILPGTESKFLSPLEIKKLYGVGPKTALLLNELGIETCFDLVSIDIQKLLPIFGQHSVNLKNKAKGIDNRPVDSSPWIPKQQGTDTTFEKDISDVDTVENELRKICSEVSDCLDNVGRSARTIAIKLRWPSFETITRQKTVSGEIHKSEDIFKVAKKLLYENWKPGKLIRLMGVSASRLGVSDQQKLPLEFE
ncbi:MAG TPA: DNA polymerase IV [Candidatus Poseidoniia archaeon]|nr:DNA polymerase IV [Candidatus Poseidoniia archaeon]